MKIKLLLVSILAAFALSACDKSNETPAKPAATAPAATAPATTPATEPAATTPAATTPATEPAATTPAAAASTGAPECDEYITKMTACVEKLPEPGRAAIVDGLNQMKSAWTEVADKSTLAAACKQAMESSKATYAAMGCTF